VKLKNFLFNDKLGFREQIINMLGVIGIAAALFFTFFNLFIGVGLFSVLTNLFTAFFIGFVLRHANRTNGFKLYSFLSVVSVFLLMFPIMFFSSGGYHSGMPSFFLFALVFTAIILEGKRRVVILVIEFILFYGCFAVAYIFPDTVVNLATEADVKKDIIFGCIVAGFTLVAAINRHIVCYDDRMKELEILREEQREQNHRKTEFLKFISHELKTPITIMSNYARDTLREIERDEHNYTEMSFNQRQIVTEGEYLNRMVGQLLEITAIESGHVKIDKQPLSLADVIHHATEACAARLLEGSNRLVLDIADDLSDVNADHDIIRQILLNFLMNAARHTKRGTVTVALSESDGYQKVLVSDTGDGMGADVLDRVFLQYIDRDKSPDNNGLGLYICNKYVEAHGGEIDIRSERGKGTDIWFRLPV